MVDISATGASRTVVRKGTGLETPNYGSSCKGNDLLFSWIFFASSYRYIKYELVDLHSACTGFAVKLKVFRQDESVIQEYEKKIVIGEGEYHFFYLYYCTSCQ